MRLRWFAQPRISMFGRICFLCTVYGVSNALFADSMMPRYLISPHYRKTTALEKLSTSLVNVVVVYVAAIPFFLLDDLAALTLKLILIGLFFLENVVAIIFWEYRLPGMLIQNTIWQCRYSKINQLIHAVMYTASFATLLFCVWIPGDLLLLNLLLVQLPCVLLTKTTFHGLMAGNMVDVKLVKLVKD